MSGIATGTRLGGYRLDRRLGAGAVGEVYRARDLKLDRDVAVKVLRPELAADPERLRRFAREARAASALNHPGIVHIYDVGRDGGVPFLAMELVEGKTLRQLLADGPLAEADLLELAVQLTEGLAKAHAGGIVHRDLKPDNLMVSADGYLKILDFGLAKLWASSAEEAAAVGRETQDGAVLGTAAYMSPEQAGGGKVDFRSDLFSVGAILYEMATGRPAFGGGSLAETLAAVIRARPEPLARLAPDMPAELGTVVERCLAKKPERRFASTQDLARELRALRDRARLTGTVDSDTYFAALDAHARRRRRVATLGVAALAAVAAAVAAIVVLALRRDAPPPELARSLAAGRLRLLAAATVPDGRPRDPDLSRDGKQFVFVDETGGRVDLFLGRVAGGARVRLTDDAAIESHPDFSPDGERVAYTCLRPSRVEPDLCTVPVLGGRVAVLVEGASMPAWSPDGGRLAFVLRRPGAPLALAVADVPAAPGDAADAATPRILLAGDGTYPFLYQPAWSPDGRRLAVRRSVGGVAGEIWLVPAAGGAPTRLSRDPPGVFAHDPVWSADGSGVVVASNRAGATNLWLLGTGGGEPVRLTSGPGPDELPSVAADGTVAFLSTIWRYSLRLHDLDDGAGSRELLSHNSYLWAPAFSSDGATLAFSRAEVDGAWHLWSLALKGGGELRQLTDGESGEVYPRFLAGGGLTFNTWSPPRRILHLPASGGVPRPLESGGPAAYADVSPDGRSVAFARQDRGEERVYVQPWGGGPARLLTASPATLPRWSPDGRWIAFSPDRSVFRGVFVIAADGSGERRLTATGGWPVWWPDGARIGYLDVRKSGDQEVRTVPFAGGPSEAIEGLSFVGTNHPFDVDPTGRFLAASDSAPVTSQIWLLEPAR